MNSSPYDFVFLGAGCASLSLLMRMIKSGKFEDKKILLIDKDRKEKNDRTWCYWETKDGFFEEIVYKRWPVIRFISDDLDKELDISPYVYKMVRGIDFYNYCFQEIKKHPNIELVYGNLDRYEFHKDGLDVTIDDNRYQLGNPITFNSVYRPKEDKRITRLLQHFKGWVIETDQPSFDPGKAIMMDFRVSQQHGTTFCYLLPFTDRKALVDYTLFTPSLLSPGEYDEGLKDYLQRILGLKNYQIIEEEFGVIPMTNERLRFRGNAWQIGTAGGQTKASSGYTFQFIQKRSDEIVDKLLKGESLDSIHDTPGRFRFYDNTLLHILYHNKLPGKKIFSVLFRKNKPQQVLRFLDNESSLGEELKIISTLPTWPFLKAAIGGFRG